MKRKTILCCIVLFSLSALAGDTNVTTRVREFDLDKDGKKEYRSEQTFRGTNNILSVIRNDKSTEIAVMIGNGYMYSEADKDGDGHFESIAVMKDFIPTEMFERSKDGKITPVDTAKLEEIKENSKVFVEGFGAMVDIVRGTNQQEKAILRAVFSNLCEKAEQEGSQQRPERDK